MPYRVKVHDAVIECDTADEAMALLNLRRSSIPLSVVSSVVDNQPVSIKTHPMSSRREHRVSNSVTKFLLALKDAYPGPLTSEEIAEKLNTTPRGLPAVVVGARVLFKRLGVKFEEMIEWSKRVENENIVRQYQLTRRGLDIIENQYSQEDLAVSEQNDNASSM